MSSNKKPKYNYAQITLNLLAWVGFVIIWYLVLSFTTDTPAEYRLRHSTDNLRSEYAKLSKQNAELNRVMDNIIARDENVFRKLFESNPYDLSAAYQNSRFELRSSLNRMDNDELSETLESRLSTLKHRLKELQKSHDELNFILTTDSLNKSIDNIPSIQPVNNKQLTLLAAGKKTLINPFYRDAVEHHGVDYLIPEGTPVFATAPGVVKSLSEKNSTHGKAIIIDHGNGYETSYSHLLDIRVRKGSKVKRGDIIATSGNSGLSFAPHLHYEVIYNDLRVDPVHYFFMELTPEEYQRIIRISLSSMQSFD